MVCQYFVNVRYLFRVLGQNQDLIVIFNIYIK